MQQLGQRGYLSNDLKGVCQVNLKIMARCLHFQIFFWKFCIVFFYGSLCFSEFSLLDGIEGEGEGVENPQNRVTPLTEIYFKVLVDSPNQILIPALNNDFQVIT